MADQSLDEIDALLHAVRGFSNEQLGGVPAADVPNPIADLDELTDAVDRVVALLQSIPPPTANPPQEHKSEIRYEVFNKPGQ